MQSKVLTFSLLFSNSLRKMQVLLTPLRYQLESTENKAKAFADEQFQ